MKTILTLLFTLFLSLTFAQTGAPGLIPQPARMQIGKGFFTFTGNTIISFNTDAAGKPAQMLTQKLRNATGFSFNPVKGNKGQVQFNLHANADPELGSEGYTLVCTRKGVTITANEPAGLFYGMQTLLQLLPAEVESKSPVYIKWTVPVISITDYPRFAWRGLMLDVARNFFSKEEVKQYIDEMVKYKFNTFHWHLTDDEGWRIEIKSLPKLTQTGAWRVERHGHFGDRDNPKPGEKATVGGFYTQDDIREIIAYANERFVTIVPEIDVPGHSMAAIASYPELSCRKDTSTKVNPGSRFSEWYGNGTFKMNIENALNPSDENVYVFLDKVFTEVAALFPGQYIHVGGDECYKGYWLEDEGCKSLMQKLGIRHVEDLQGYFLDRVDKIVKSKGKKIIGWDEILDGGISPDAAVMSWRGVKGGIEAARQGHYVVMSPTTYAYLDYVQGERTVDPPIYASLRMQKCYSFEPVPEGVDPKFILGGQGNLWSEQLPTFRHAQYMTYPRAWALAEVFWSPKETRNWNNFIGRVENQFQRSDIAQVAYSRAIYDAIVTTAVKNYELILSMDCEVPGMEIYYTIDDAMPDQFSTRYTGPVALPQGPITLRAITYRNGRPAGHLITLKRDELLRRAAK